MAVHGVGDDEWSRPRPGAEPGGEPGAEPGAAGQTLLDEVRARLEQLESFRLQAPFSRREHEEHERLCRLEAELLASHIFTPVRPTP